MNWVNQLPSMLLEQINFMGNPTLSGLFNIWTLLENWLISSDALWIDLESGQPRIDEEKIVCEMAASAFRAGADLYITYYAKELAKFIREGRIG